MTIKPPAGPSDEDSEPTWERTLIASLPVPTYIESDAPPSNPQTLRTEVDIVVSVSHAAHALAFQEPTKAFAYAGSSLSEFDTPHYHVRLQRKGSNARFTIRPLHSKNRIKALSLRGSEMPVIKNTPKEYGLSEIKVSPLPAAMQFDFELEVSGSEVVELIDIFVTIEFPKSA